jgi:hypothetical protein
MCRGPQHHDDLKNLLTTLDIGSHINASLQLLPEADATQEWTLEAVSCKALLNEALRAVSIPSLKRRPS